MHGWGKLRFSEHDHDSRVMCTAPRGDHVPILCSVRAILRPMRLLQEYNVWPVQLQPNKEFGVEGRREAATIVTQDAEPAIVSPLGLCMHGGSR